MLVTSLSLIAELIGNDQVWTSFCQSIRGLAILPCEQSVGGCDECALHHGHSCNVFFPLMILQKSGAFVYGAISFTDKLSSGGVIAIIQEMNPRSSMT